MESYGELSEAKPKISQRERERMKQSSRNTRTYFSMDEKEVSAILLLLPHLILESESLPGFSFTWGAKRRRSVNNDTISRPPSNDGPIKKVAALSPDTPLCFSPSESDGKSKHSKRKVSLKRKREEYLKIIDELTERKGLLKGEIETVKRYRDKLKAYNLDLKARKQELTIGLKREKSLNLENQDHHHYDHHQQIHIMVHQPPLIIDRTAHKLEPSENSAFPYGQMLSLTPSNSGRLSKVNDNVDLLGIPDLNVCPEESFEMEPCVLEMTNKSIAKALAAQARQKRIQICKSKNSNAANKQRCPFR